MTGSICRQVFIRGYPLIRKEESVNYHIRRWETSLQLPEGELHHSYLTSQDHGSQVLMTMTAWQAERLQMHSTGSFPPMRNVAISGSCTSDPYWNMPEIGFSARRFVR